VAAANIAGVEDETALSADVAEQERFDEIHLIEIAMRLLAESG
jgi:hypothetical protein